MVGNVQFGTWSIPLQQKGYSQSLADSIVLDWRETALELCRASWHTTLVDKDQRWDAMGSCEIGEFNCSAVVDCSSWSH